MKIILKAPAKINLFLEIQNKRKDGYHNLESIMQTVSLYDELSFELVDSGIYLECESRASPTGSNNIVYKAVKAFNDYFKIDKGVHIYLKKVIPAGAGLGGGSSDAAATLVALVKLHNVKTTKQELEQIAYKLGADVPFFLTGGTALCKGAGELVTPLKSIENLEIILVSPGFELNTASIYKKIKFPLTNGAEINRIKSLVSDGSFSKSEAFGCCFNRLEDFVLPDYPEIQSIKHVLRNCGCMSLMSGSGATVFGLFDSTLDTDAVKSALSKFGWNFWFVNPTNFSLQHQLSN